MLTLSLCVAARTERSLITPPSETVSIDRSLETPLRYMERVFSGTLKGLLLFRLENIGCLIQNMTLMIRNDDFEKVLSCVLIHTHRSTHQGPIFDGSLDASKRLDSSDICTKFDGIF